MKKIKVGILFGGKSAEHEVSLQSAKNVFEAIDKDKYDVTLIGIDKVGKWFLLNPAKFLHNENNPKLIALDIEGADAVALVPSSGGLLTNLTEGHSTQVSIDVVFPILHGPFGEDGTLQGLLKLAGVPFVGSSVLGSAVGMDKDVMKRLLRDAGLPIGKFLAFKEEDEIDFAGISAQLGLPLFVKPANLGSSVGISKVNNQIEFEKAVALAFSFDNKIIIEEFIAGRELECSVLGNQFPLASGVGEIIPTHEFYSYDAKYIDDKGAIVEIPAKVSEEIKSQVQTLALKTFKTLSCEGLGRIDFFLKSDGSLLINEINTIPGFTKISMYPQLWHEAGVSYPDLIDRLLELALERFAREKKLESDF